MNLLFQKVNYFLRKYFIYIREIKREIKERNNFKTHILHTLTYHTNLHTYLLLTHEESNKIRREFIMNSLFFNL